MWKTDERINSHNYVMEKVIIKILILRKDENDVFCSKCGKEIPDNATFCTFCGEKNNNGFRVVERKNNPVMLGRCFEVIAAIISVVVAVGVVRIAYVWFESNQEAFYWCDSSGKLFGKCLHWGICMLFCAESIVFLRLLKKGAGKLLSIKFGAALILEGLVLEVLGRAYNDWTGTDQSIVLFRVFGLTYSNIVGFTIWMGILLIICGIVVFVKGREG